MNSARGLKEGVEKFVAAQKQGMRGSLEIDVSGIADEKIRQEVSLAVRDMNRNQKNQNTAASKGGGKIMLDTATNLVGGMGRGTGAQ